jgi:hypothetical protein
LQIVEAASASATFPTSGRRQLQFVEAASALNRLCQCFVVILYTIFTSCAGQNEKRERGGWSVTGWLLKTPVSGDRQEKTKEKPVKLRSQL